VQRPLLLLTARIWVVVLNFRPYCRRPVRLLLALRGPAKPGHAKLAVVEEMGFLAAYFGGSAVCLGAGRSDEAGQLLPQLCPVQE
jgi:hypothetical protein